MKYRPGIVGEGSGSLGSMTFSRNRFGPYIRQRVAGVNPNTARQQAVRSTWQALSVAWSAELTQANRDAWNLYASNVTFKDSLGRDILLTGYQAFMRSATVAIGGEVVQPNAGPTIFTLAQADETMVGTVDETGQEISVAFDDARDWVDEDGALMQIQMSKPVSVGRTYIQPTYRIAGYILGNNSTPETSPVVLPVPFAVAEGQKVLVAGRILNADGRLSSHFLHTATITS